MRIICGKFKGLRFEPPKDITARPTTDFAKESLFNVLSNYIDFEGITALDLFAGTGSIGYEFISRGAKSVTAVEMCLKQLNFILNTAKKMKINNLTVHRSDVFRYIEKCGKGFDVIFADPPYQMTELDTLPNLIFEHNLLNGNGIFILEHNKKNSFKTNKYFFEQRDYGNVHFSFFRLN
ncbi:MAG: 16S rRNA (guanine(966)-N(2))-methyltransferase RsmD [Prevotellaceae bacterium]|jgi:16S rRNA (guanine(966)-N(2))-methyltransferase RsmD|nr:16S rRNA (guanine(966)-N(2))-methyltransferase RsmD [Prevotellaceae bacterium]